MTANPTKRFYDRISGAYDMIADASEHESREKGLRLLAVQPGERVLEIGYGTGHSLVSLAKAVGPEGHVWGIDISDGMQRVATERVEAAGLAGRVTLRLGEVPPLPYEDGQFDAVTMSFTLELFPPDVIPTVLAEIGRVLRDAGRVGVVGMAATPPGEHPGMMEKTFQWLHHHFPHIVDCRPIDAEALLAEAGFDVEQCERMSIWSLPVAAVVGRYREAAFKGREATAGEERQSAIELLVAHLGSKHPRERVGARRGLARFGSDAVPALARALASEDHHVRWEAGKCLASIAHPSAAPALIDVLADRNSDVRWVAGEALIALGPEALVPLLEALLRAEEQGSADLYHGAHHVLRELAAQGNAELLSLLLDAFGHAEPQLAVPVEAHKALESLRARAD